MPGAMDWGLRLLVGIAILLASATSIGAQHVEGRLRAASIDAAWIGGAAALDLASTRYALSRCPACYEANPLMRTTSTQLAVKAATTAGAVFIADRIRRSGHPRAARVFRWVAVGVWTGLAVHNMAQARR